MVSMASLGNDCETPFRFLNATLVSASAGLKLRFAVRTEQLEVCRSVVGVVAINVIKHKRQSFAVPLKRLRVENAGWIVATERSRRALLAPPSHVVPADC